SSTIENSPRDSALADPSLESTPDSRSVEAAGERQSLTNSGGSPDGRAAAKTVAAAPTLVKLLVTPRAGGAVILVASDGSVELRPDGVRARAQRLRAPGPAGSAAISPDGALLGVGWSGFVTVCELASGRELFTSRVVRGRATAMDFSPDSRSL